MQNKALNGANISAWNRRILHASVRRVLGEDNKCRFGVSGNLI